MKTASLKKSIFEKGELSWNFQDYLLQGYEPPERIVQNPHKTEGELMGDEEIVLWFSDHLKTLPIIKEEQPKIFEKIYQEFVLDVKYLYSLRRIDQKILEFSLEKSNFDFYE